MASVRTVEHITSERLSWSAESSEMPNKRHRVLYVQHGGGGTATALYDLLQCLDKNLYEPIVLYYESDPYLEKIKGLGVKVLILSTKSPALDEIVFQPETTAYLHRYGKGTAFLYRSICACIMVNRVVSLIKREGISLVHHNDNLRQDRFTVLAAWLAGVPQVCHMHAFSQLFWFEKLLIRTVDSFIYVSKAVEKYYLDFQLPVDKGLVIYNGFNVASSEQVAPQEVSQIRSEFNVGDQEILISNVGRLDVWKGQDYFIEAIAQVIQPHPHVKALIVGAPGTRPHLQAYYQKLQKLVADLNLANHVIFTGFRSDIPQIMAASDILVHSASEPEPFGRVIVEGMLSKRLVIGVDAGGVPEIIDDQLTGLLVPTKNAAKMAAAILWVINHPEQAARMGETAQQKAKERFSIEQHVFSIQQIYQKILNV